MVRRLAYFLKKFLFPLFVSALYLWVEAEGFGRFPNTQQVKYDLLHGKIQPLLSRTTSRMSSYKILVETKASEQVQVPYIQTCAINCMILTKIFRGMSLGTTLRLPFGNRVEVMDVRRLAEEGETRL